MKQIILFLSFTILLLADHKSFKIDIEKKIIEELPKIACSSKLYKECYSVSEKECNTLMTLFAKSCFKNYENNMTSDKTLNELAQVGNTIGQCTGFYYDMTLQNANKADVKCLNDPKWLKKLTKQSSQ